MSDQERPHDEPAHPVMINNQVCTGMDLSDYFAGQALPALIEQHGGRPEQAFAISAMAYTIAEAMLVVRSKKNEDK